MSNENDSKKLFKFSFDIISNINNHFLEKIEKLIA